MSTESVDLPPEVWVKILGYVPVYDLCQVLLTSRHMKAVASDPHLYRNMKVNMDKVKSEEFSQLRSINRFKKIKKFDFEQFDFNNTYNNVGFSQVGTTDYYRKGNPYKIFQNPGVSQATISFQLKKSEVDIVSSLQLTLNHCRTSADGEVDIFFNDKLVFEKVLAPKWDFGREVFVLNDVLKGNNTVKIVLKRRSPGVYWLSDALITVLLK